MKKKSFRCSICGAEINDLFQSYVITMKNTEDYLNSLSLQGNKTFSFLFCRNCYHSFLYKLKNFIDEVKNG